ncbi:hypothetical protein HOE425_333207 [Hoeflea sp. EC-HK425]|nr:hypothetical protein HOE425_333207 [Hoeflea sp. EC-HK425]
MLIPVLLPQDLEKASVWRSSMVRKANVNQSRIKTFAKRAGRRLVQHRPKAMNDRHASTKLLLPLT